jgi:hypothetical protein
MFKKVIQFFSRSSSQGDKAPLSPDAPNEYPQGLTGTFHLQDFSGLYGIVRLQLPGVEEKLLVTAFDSRKLAFVVSPNFDKDILGTCHECQLIIDHKRIPIWICCVARDKNIFISQVVRTLPGSSADMDIFLDPVRLGKELREIDSSLIKSTTENDKMRWFRSGPSCDVYLWESPDGQTTSLQIWWESNLIEWTKEKGLQSGTAADLSDKESLSGYDRTELFSYHAELKPECVDWAYRFASASILPKSIRKLMKP